MCRGESTQARNEPSRSKSRFDREPQAPRLDAPDRIDCPIDSQEPGRELGRKFPSGCGELNGAMQTPEQLASDLVFERAHMAADRRLRNVKFTGSVGKAESPRRRLKCPEGKQRRMPPS